MIVVTPIVILTDWRGNPQPAPRPAARDTRIPCEFRPLTLGSYAVDGCVVSHADWHVRARALEQVQP